MLLTVAPPVCVAKDSTTKLSDTGPFLPLTENSRRYYASFQWMASSVTWRDVTFMMVFVVEYLATQTGGATVNNIFEVRFTYTKID